MIDREQVERCLTIMDHLAEDSVDLVVDSNGKISLRIYPKHWWINGNQWTDEKRHEVLALVTPLVGRLDKHVDGTTIGYRGEKENLSVFMNYVDKCKILGYKTVTKTIKKEIEREPEFEEEEVTERVPITDCDVRTGKAKVEDIQVPI